MTKCFKFVALMKNRKFHVKKKNENKIKMILQLHEHKLVFIKHTWQYATKTNTKSTLDVII